MNEHPVTVDIGHPQVDAFLQAQITRVDGAETNPVMPQTQASQYPVHLFPTEYHRQFVLFAWPHQLKGGPLPS